MEALPRAHAHSIMLEDFLGDWSPGLHTLLKSPGTLPNVGSPQFAHLRSGDGKYR